MELVFATTNSDRFSKKPNPGQCMGMSCDWAKVSLVLKNVYFDALTPGKWDIGQSAYLFGVTRTGQVESENVKIIKAFGMSITGQGVRHNIGTSQDVVNHLAALPNGTYVWGIVGNGGHALGYRKSAAGYDLFDPNVGMQTTTVLADFKQTVKDLIDNNYSGLLQLMDIYQVE